MRLDTSTEAEMKQYFSAGNKTPLDYLPNSKDSRVELWCKREDLIDGVGSGHKGRKLKYVMEDAKQADATVVITAASTPSGQAVAVAAAANRAGLRAHIVYCGEGYAKPSVPEGNYLLLSLLEAEITWRENETWLEWSAYISEAAERERWNGETPYVITPGLSGGHGLLGSVELGFEIADQLPDAQIPTHVVAVAGSGGTCLGLGIAAASLGLPWQVHGVCISTGGSRTKSLEQDAQLRLDAARFLPSSVIEKADIDFWDGAMGNGYDNPTEIEFEALQSGLKQHGLILDTTYMAKAYLGMMQMIDAGLIEEGSRVVLVHSGGSFDVFRSQPARDVWLRKKLQKYVAP